jgi:trimethylamine--corrinoid protein Co-methyltransferase
MIGVPFGYGTGGVSDAQSIGVQAGMERAITTLSGALAGVEVIHDGVSGILQSGLLVSAEQMVIDNEMCRIIRRIVRGIDVTEETLAQSAISSGPGSNFLTAMHTAKHFRKEILLTPLFDGSASAGRDACIERAREMAEKTVRAHAGPYLTEHQMRGMMDVWCRVGLDEQVGRRVLMGSAV